MRTKPFALVLMMIMASHLLFAHTGEVLISMRSPAHFAGDMTFDGDHLWLCDRKADLLYRVDPATGKVVKTLPSPGYWPSALTWDGKHLWCADIKGGKDVEEEYDGIIYQLDPANGNILSTLVSPASHPVGLAWDGDYLWCIDNRSDEIIRFNASDGTTIRSFRAPAADCRGLTFDGTYLWTCDRTLDEIYMINPETGYVLLITPSPGPFPRGLAWDGKSLWHTDFETDMIYQLAVADGENYTRYNERKGKVTFTHQVKNFGPGKVLTADVHLAIPTNRENQMIEKVRYNVDPDDMVTDSWGQKTAHFRYTNIPAGENRLIEMTTEATTYDVRYFIFPDRVGSLSEIPQEIRDKYLENNEKFQFDHPVIQKALKEAVGEEKNPYWIARKIFNHIIENMYYEMSGGWNTAPTVLDRGNGSCSEYTFVFISMCRAAGLPARYVGSVVVRGDDASFDDVFHRWAEVYIPNYGWIPVDGSRGDKDWPRDQANAIGYVNGRLLITTQSGGGSETMEWTYNSNRFWTTEPKTYVNFEHFADWEPR